MKAVTKVRRIKVKKRSLVAGALSVLLLSGCGPSYVSVKPLDLPAKNYPVTNTDKSIAFAIIKPQIVVKTKISSDLSRGLNARLQHDVNQIACHLMKEMQKMLIARGIDVTQTFDSPEDMTFTQKRETTALLYPQVTIELEQHTNTLVNGRVVENTEGDIQIKATTSLVMYEPLSNEKVWIKHLSTKKESVQVNYPGLLQNNASPFQVEERVVNVAENIDNLLVSIDKEILKSVDKFVTKEEFIFLNDDIKKLKNIKRY